MQTLQISEAQARRIYQTATAELKAILEETFPANFFSQKITDRVKTLQDAYHVAGKRCEIGEGLTPDEVAYKHLKVVAEALNEGWTPNWNDEDEYKYYPWFYLNGPSGFRLDCVGWDCAVSTVGSRLCFRSKELAEFAATQFHDLYKQFFTI